MLCLIRSKACKKCGGDLSVESDIYGVYIQCIQCGANYNREDLISQAERDAEKSLKAVKAGTLASSGR